MVLIHWLCVMGPARYRCATLTYSWCRLIARVVKGVYVYNVLHLTSHWVEWTTHFIGVIRGQFFFNLSFPHRLVWHEEQADAAAEHKAGEEMGRLKRWSNRSMTKQFPHDWTDWAHRQMETNTRKRECPCFSPCSEKNDIVDVSGRKFYCDE